MGRVRIKKSEKADVVTFGEAREAFINEKTILATEKTVANYDNSIIKFMNVCGYDDFSNINALSLTDIYRFIGHERNEGLSVSSINHYLTDIRVFCYWCMDDSREYVEDFSISLLRKQEEPPKCFDDDELELLLERPKKGALYGEWRCWAITNWILATGNRAGTVCEVKLGDIDFRKKEITLSHTKNKKAQIIPLSGSLEGVVKEFIRIWRSDATDNDYLFADIGNQQLSVNALGHSFRKYCNDRGVEKNTSIHGLRHTFARGWVRNGGDPFRLQKILGHSSLEMTNRYVRLFGEDLKKDYDDFSVLDTMKSRSKRTAVVKRNK